MSGDVVTDSYFKIGSTHTVCEDYALSGYFKNKNDQNVFYAIISDGCSSSCDVDTGARILCHSALNSIKDFYSNDGGEDYFDYIKHRIGDDIAINSKAIKNSLRSLDRYCLDATLAFAVVGEDYGHAYVYGDGNVVVKFKDKTVVYNIEFSMNAPYYLSYSVDPERGLAYQAMDAQCGMTKTITTTVLDVDGVFQGKEMVSCAYDDMTIIDIDHSDGMCHSISVFSDGIETYKDKSKDEDIFTSIDYFDIAFELTSFKNYGAGFSQRRINSFHRRGKDSDMKHEDDVSCASIVLKKNI